MFRSMSRTATVAVVALMLVLASVPAAQASSFSGPSLDIRSGWLDAALTWLDGLLFGEETSSPTSSFEAVEPIEGDDDLGALQSGTCIDPAGRPRPCPVI